MIPPEQRLRLAALLRRHPELRGAMATPADCATVRGRAQTAIELVAAGCDHFAGRTCLGARDRALDLGFLPSFHTVTYARLWERVVALASGWANEGLVAPGDFVGIAGFGSIDWVVADLAVLYRGAVSVPLPTSLVATDLRHIVNEAELSSIACTAADVPLLAQVLEGCPGVRSLIVMDVPAPAEVEQLLADWRARLRVLTIEETEAAGAQPSAPQAMRPDALATLIYTSGVTGPPKGVMYRERDWRIRLTPGFFADMPYITVGSVPLCHVWGRTALLYLGLNHGGATYFTARSDMSTLFEDIRLVRPTVVWLPPRVATVIYEHFQSEVTRRAAAAPGVPPGRVAIPIVMDMRERFLGDRLYQIELGGAPTTPEIQDFLRECFDVRVVDAYGSTELGSIAVNNRLRGGIRYRLEDVPELGYSAADKPYPRGELLVKSATASAGYFKNAAASAALADGQGFLRSGDIVEERGPGHVVLIDRKQNVLKLAQGEFVSVARLEELYAANSALIHQIFVHADPRRSFLLAVVVPGIQGRGRDDTALKPLLRGEFDRIASTLGLPRHEVPRDFLIEREPFTPENNLLTDANKLRRRAVQAAYGPRLAALYASIDARQRERSVRPRPDATVAEKVMSAIAATLGLPPAELGATSFVGLGGDSLSATELCVMLEGLLGVAPPAASILDPGNSVAALVADMERRVAGGEQIDFHRIHGPGTRPVEATDLRVGKLLPVEVARAIAQPRAAVADAPRTVLLTGANGFLGRFLLLELLERAAAAGGQVVCLVRGADDRAARERLRASFAEAFVGRFEALAGGDRLVVRAGNLMTGKLGLDAPTHDDLAGRIDTIVHGGALVNHALSYRRLFEPNVLGTAEVMRLALTGRRKSIHFISSIAAVARPGAPILEREGAAELWPRRPAGDAAGYAVGYGTSKWACEVLLRDVHRQCGVPINVFRTSTILPHREHAVVNEADALMRLLYAIAAVGLAPASFYGPDCAERHVDGVPVDVVATAVAAIAMTPAEGYRTFHVCNARWDDGISLDRFVDWMEAAGLAIVRVPSYSEWFARFRERLEGRDDLRRRSPLPILHRWARPEGAVLKLDNRGFRDKLRELTPLGDVPAIDERMFRRWLRALAADEVSANRRSEPS